MKPRSAGPCQPQTRTPEPEPTSGSSPQQPSRVASKTPTQSPQNKNASRQGEAARHTLSRGKCQLRPVRIGVLTFASPTQNPAKPITVAGPWPIQTAFPNFRRAQSKNTPRKLPVARANAANRLSKPAKLLRMSLRAARRRVNETRPAQKRNAPHIAPQHAAKNPLPVLPLWRAFLHQRPQAFLRVLEIRQLIQENLHRIPHTVAQRQAEAAQNRLLRHR